MNKLNALFQIYIRNHEYKYFYEPGKGSLWHRLLRRTLVLLKIVSAMRFVDR